MNQHGTSYHYQRTAPTPTRAAATSSAFSASAHPHEDWTKITDLAERRRIQNRIAQRNYRKKLKKRLEDLEMRAASNSASPERQPAQLNQTKKSPKKKATPAQNRPAPIQTTREPSQILPIRVSEAAAPMGFPVMTEDRMFSLQHTRQLSTSPPPPVPMSLPLSQAGPDPYGYPHFTTQISYDPNMIASCSEPMVNPYQTAYAAPYPSPIPHGDFSNVKLELYPDVELNPFSNMGYAPIQPVEIPGQPFGDSMPPTPPLSETYEQQPYSQSPSETRVFPHTPASFSPSPPIALV